MGEQENQRIKDNLSRSDFEKEFALARAEKRAPMLTGVKAIGVDLSGLDFSSEYEGPYGPHSGVYLGIDLRNAKLRNCILEGCDFGSSNLRGADLSNSNLRDIILYSTLLESANLQEADLSGANLISAEISKTGFDNTILKGVRFGHTAISETDLSAAIGLGSTNHHSPSPIDSRSLRLTSAGLADKPAYQRQEFFRFLFAAGIDEEFLPTVHSWVGQPIEYHSIFISHSSLDKEFARKIYHDLQALSVKCWLDEKKILPGDSILEEVDRGIKLWDRLLLVCSRNSLSPTTGWWVEQELERALEKEREFRRSGHNIGTIIPITIDDYVFAEWSSRYRATVLERKVGDFRNADTQAYAESLGQLVAALDRDRRL
jgi:TIR domain/Pentapeptide repeats (8 copies)